MKELEKDTVEGSELVEQTFKFWFNDNEHIRSPFPDYIQRQLKLEATDLFYNWTKKLNNKAKEELNDEIIGEKFEEIIFEQATKLIKTEDERITIIYPFLPRTGDLLKNGTETDSQVIDRTIIKEGDTSFLKLKMKKSDSEEVWDTQIELPI